MEVVRQVMEELQLDIPIAGLAKDRKHRTSEVLSGFHLKPSASNNIAPYSAYWNRYKMKYIALPLPSTGINEANGK